MKNIGYLGLFIFFVGMSVMAYLKPGFFRHWDGDMMIRGDKVEFTSELPDHSAVFYKNCDITFLTSQATETDNVAFVLLKNCNFQKTGHQRVDNPAVDIFSMRYLKRIQ